MVTATALLLIALSYLIGSAPSGYLLVRGLCGLDLREHGSHSIGAINACSVGGPGMGIAALLLDVGKACGVVLLAAALARSPWVIAAAGLSVMVGHAFSFWLFVRERRFSEGKSVACALGALLGLSRAGAVSWHVPAGVLGLWLVGLFGPRLVTGRWSPISPATMASAIALPVIVYAARSGPAYLALAAATAALILVRHKGNIRRLLAETEPPADQRLSRRAPSGRAESGAERQRGRSQARALLQS